MSREPVSTSLENAPAPDAVLFRVQIGRHDLARLLARDDRHDLEGRAEPLAVQDPLLQEPGVVAFHELKAAVKIGLDPAPDVFEPSGNLMPASRTHR